MLSLTFLVLGPRLGIPILAFGGVIRHRCWNAPVMAEDIRGLLLNPEGAWRKKRDDESTAQVKLFSDSGLVAHIHIQ